MRPEDDDDEPMDTDDQKRLVEELSQADARGSRRLCVAIAAGCIALAVAKLYWAVSTLGTPQDELCDYHPHARFSSWRAAWIPGVLELASAGLFCATAYSVAARAPRVLHLAWGAALVIGLESLLFAGASLTSTLWLVGFNVVAPLLALLALSAVRTSQLSVEALRGSIYRFKSV